MFRRKVASVVCVACLLMVNLTVLVSAKNMTFTVWQWDSRYLEILKPELEKYTKLYPDIKFESTVIPYSDIWKKLMALIAADVPSVDFLICDPQQLVMFIPHLEAYPEDLFPLSEMREDNLGFDQGYVWPDGKFYDLPTGAMSSLIYYNQRMWVEKGLGHTPRTWDEFRETAIKLTEYGANGDLEIAGLQLGNYLQLLWQDLLYQQGGWLYNEDGTEIDESWIGPPGVKSATFLQDLILKDKVTQPGWLSYREAFGTEKAAMIYCWTWITGLLDFQYPEVNYGVFTIPTETGKMYPAVARNTYGNFFVMPKIVPEERKGEIWKFLRWLYDNDEYMINFSTSAGMIPTKKDLWSNPEILSNRVINVVRQQIAYTIFPGEWHASMFTAGNNFTIRIEQGESVDKCLKEYKLEIDTALKQSPIKWNAERKYTPPKE